MTMIGSGERCLPVPKVEQPNEHHHEPGAAENLSQSLNIHPRQILNSNPSQNVDVSVSPSVKNELSAKNGQSQSSQAALNQESVYQDNMQVAPVLGNPSVKEGTSVSLCAPGVFCAGFSHQEESEKYRQTELTKANCQGLDIVGKQFERLVAAGLTEMANTYAKTHMMAASESCITTGGGAPLSSGSAVQPVDAGEYATKEELRMLEQREIDRANQLYPRRFEK